MTRERREAEAILLATFAAAPLFFTGAIDLVSVGIYHLVMASVFVLELARPGFRTPRILLRLAGVAYFFFFFIDSIGISRSLIRGTAHLLFFIAIYQSLDREAAKRHSQRLLVTLMLAIASIATSTHITIAFFVVGLAILMFRQLIGMNHAETMRLIGRDDDYHPQGRAALRYAVPMILLAILIFPFLPRVRDPFVRGLSGALRSASTGFSDSIDLNNARTISSDPSVVARVDMPTELTVFFTPIRLRGGHYDRYAGNKWSSRPVKTDRFIVKREDGFHIGTPREFTGTVSVRQTRIWPANQQLFLPVGTFRVEGISQMLEASNEGRFLLPGRGSALLTYDAEISPKIDSFRPTLQFPQYNTSEEIRSLADQIAVNATNTRENAVVIERYLATQFEYLPNAERRQPINTERFLLEERRGHCEHFAAGMVLLLAARGVPARVVGGYYGGERNPLTGYFVIRQRDAHAWVEVWEDNTWVTYDPTPVELRPGTAIENIVLAYLRAAGESINFFWDRYILTFGLTDQVRLALNALWGVRDMITSIKRGLAVAPSFGRIAVIILIFVAVAMLIAMLFVRPRFRRTTFERLAGRLRSIGVIVTPAMTTEEILETVKRRHPQLVTPVRIIVDCYRLERFSHTGPTVSQLAAANVALGEIRQAT